ncbi:selenoprotein B, glycine/betaine/sarcosine/D-proline reductase family [Desulfosporosinus orientis DSM 765]|uniref:Selenoprotein B, glycine/betaine/sarcosine/D-proline reductase family n=3 Tax=Desulfosporosinus orientis TaxID=1563 RepID=G7WBH7_DESOD|nr:selenoprotein B, glycine/betaine/sarcosine/D-proline reductase family [Desulfosporosinus orientis DSM 765]
MSDQFKVLYYVNQFFGQIGGEDKAGMPPEFRPEKIGPALGFEGLLKGEGTVVGTIICGDNFFNENTRDALGTILGMVKEAAPDVFIAGPAFNAGRYGVACGELAKAVVQELNIPAITGMYQENPGLDSCKALAYVVRTSDSAGGMRKALPTMAVLARKLGNRLEVDSPEEEGYIPQGMRKTLTVEKRGSQRAVEMLIARLKGQPFTTEMPMPVFDVVAPAQPIKDLSTATIALCTSGGIVPEGNPDRIQSASAQKWGKYNVADRKALDAPDFYTTHGGYDPVYANEIPDRVAPLDILKEFEAEGYIGSVFEWFYTTTGTGTAVNKSVEFGAQIGRELLAAGVDGVILTST